MKTYRCNKCGLDEIENSPISLRGIVCSYCGEEMIEEDYIYDEDIIN